MDWTRTRSVLADLGQLLTCAICKSYLADPCTLGNCDHNFCRKCIKESLGNNSKCPECGVFSWLKDLRLNHQLATTVNMTLKLQSLIGLNMEVEDIVPRSIPVSPAQSSTVASDIAVDHAKQPITRTDVMKSMDVESENTDVDTDIQEKNHAPENTSDPLHFTNPGPVNQESRPRKNSKVHRTNAKITPRSNSTNESETDEQSEVHMTENPSVGETSDTRDCASARKSDHTMTAVKTTVVKDSSDQRAVKHAKQNQCVKHLNSRVTQQTGLKASKGNILGKSYLFRNRQNQQDSTLAEKPLDVTQCNDNQGNNHVIGNDQCADGTDHDKGDPTADDHDNDNQGNHNGVSNPATLRSKSVFFRKLACKTREDISNPLEKQEDPFQFPGDDNDDNDNTSIVQLKSKSNKRLRIARKTSEEKSHLTELTQQDPYDFGDDNKNDDDNDHDRPMLKLKSKSANKTLPKERKATRQKSNSIYYEHDKETSNGRLLRASTTKLSQKARSAVTQSNKSAKFTCLKGRPIHRKGSAVDDKKTSLKLNTKSMDPAVNEKKENATFDVKRKRVRPKRKTIRGYFIAIECAEIGDNNSDIFSDDASEMQKRKKWRKTSTSSSQSQRNVSVSSQSLKNKKGEMPLHLAAIKGDLASARELINEGADPNAKDHAGWTPLHEACNHGHVEIVELLLDNGALLNIPGFNNDTPLHDAVANDRLKVACLLVARGAVLTARNKQGLLPMDYAITKAMKAALSPRCSSNTQPTLTMSNIKCSEFSRDSQVVLGTALNTQDQVLLKKCIKLLGGTFVDEFDESVTHIVTSVNEDGHCPRTIKYLSGILAGKWIVSFKWIKDCFQRRQWLAEDVYEVKGTVGITCNPPRKARINLLQQMPRLFDGCSFFLRGVFEPPTLSKGHLIKLITLGGGKVLHREPKLKDDDLMSLPSSPSVMSPSRAPEVAYHAPANSTLSCCTEFIIYDSASCGQQKVIHSPVLRTAPVTWLMDCISSFQLLDIPDA